MSKVVKTKTHIGGTTAVDLAPRKKAQVVVPEGATKTYNIKSVGAIRGPDGTSYGINYLSNMQELEPFDGTFTIGGESVTATLTSVEEGFQLAKFMCSDGLQLEDAVEELEARVSKAPDAKPRALQLKHLCGKSGRLIKHFDALAWNSVADGVMKCLLRSRYRADPKLQRLLEAARLANITLVHSVRGQADPYKCGEFLQDLAATAAKAEEPSVA